MCVVYYTYHLQDKSSMSAPNNLGVKIKSIETLYNDISDYVENIQLKKAKIDLSIDIDHELDDMQATLAKLLKSFKSEQKSEQKNLEDKYKIWHLINLVGYKIGNIINELDELAANPRLTAGMTDTHIELIGNLFNNITNIYYKYQKDAAQQDVLVMHELTDNMKLCDIDTAANQLQNNVDYIKQYPFALSLFAYVMQKNLDNCPKLSDKITEMVEGVKDYILLSNGEPAKKGKKTPAKLYAQNPHIKTFGLTPHGPAKPLAELSAAVFPGMSEKLGVSKLSAVAKSKNVCIVILSRVTRKPIEFSLWKLMDWKYAKEFLQSASSDSGITQKTVERFDTIYFSGTDVQGNLKKKDLKKKESKAKAKEEKWNFDIAHYGDLDKSSHITVFENMGGGLYRLFALYTDRDVFNHVSGGGALDTKIPRDKIPEFINYVRNKGAVAQRTRTSEYHNIQERIITQNMFLPVKFNIDGINLNSQIIDSKFLRNELYLRLVKRCYELIEKDYKKAEKIKTHKDIGQIIHDKELSDIFNSIIVEQYDIYTFKNKENVSNFPFAETLKTFLSQLHVLNSHFVRNMHDNFIAMRIDNKIFDVDKESARNKNIYVRKLCEDIIKTTLEKLISNESNVYQGLIYKTSLLKLSVV